jgi:PPOX class probable F420-dependent enzyme
MDLEQALEFAAQNKTAALITIRRDGRPQSSDISYDIKNGVFRVSVTDDRAKTRNMRRDPRVVLHVSRPDQWSYVSFDGTVELSPVAAVPGDATCLMLADQYESVAGQPHPDWDEYFEAMVADRRLLARIRPASVVGVLR